ncbi:ECF transporter S component [Nocardioides campestrisoli]|uniref:ECF transporter S component n=1 Tax=Nocardioides campestrisoli TaxID=2736757 RepID=UPI001CD1DD28|nr:ECF transporter S component [Nocardioides campestrisoli]
MSRLGRPAGPGQPGQGGADLPAPGTPAVRIGVRSAAVLVLVSVVGLMMLAWPFLLDVPDGARVDPPFLFLALLPLLLVMVLAEMTEGGMDARVLAVLGLLAAINGVIRGLGAGVAGLELVFFLLILAGRVFGPAFGFILGATSLFVSALFTAGVGPWLPFQMLVSGWVGMGAGLLPRRVTGRAEIVMLAVYGILAAYLFGAAMNMWGWPFLLGVAVPGYEATDLSFVAGAPVLENLQRFGLYTLVTSTGGWDTGRALTNALAIALLGPSVLATLRRVARRAVVVRVSAPA